MTDSITQMAFELLEMAVDAGDDAVASACRRIIYADAFGRKVRIGDVELVLEFSDLTAE